MSVRIDKVDAEKVRKSVLTQIEFYEKAFPIVQIINDVFNAYIGKTLSKRLATAMKEKLPKDMCAYWNTDMSFYSLSIWGGVILYDQRFSFHLGFKDQVSILEKSKVEEMMHYHLGMPQRELCLKHFLPDIDKATKRYNKAIDELNTIAKTYKEYPFSDFFKEIY